MISDKIENLSLNSHKVSFLADVFHNTDCLHLESSSLEGLSCILRDVSSSIFDLVLDGDIQSQHQK